MPALTGALDDGSYHVRFVSAEALGRMGRSALDAVPALRRMLEDEKRSIRRVARKALSMIEGAE
jgi:HEAT repeat protein